MSANHIRVELFGVPRVIAGRRDVDIAVPSEGCYGDLVAALAEVCPSLVGRAIRPDLSALEAGYVFNLNGMSFLDGSELRLNPGDALLLLSSQAGG